MERGAEPANHQGVQFSVATNGKFTVAANTSGRAYGNPLRGTRDNAPAVPVGAPVIARTDIPTPAVARCRVAPNGTVIYDVWIEHDPANAERVVAELRAAAAKSLATALRRAVDR